jgi:hypothetical protein
MTATRRPGRGPGREVAGAVPVRDLESQDHKVPHWCALLIVARKNGLPRPPTFSIFARWCPGRPGRASVVPGEASSTAFPPSAASPLPRSPLPPASPFGRAGSAPRPRLRPRAEGCRLTCTGTRNTQTWRRPRAMRRHQPEHALVTRRQRAMPRATPFEYLQPPREVQADHRLILGERHAKRAWPHSSNRPEAVH